MKKQLVETPSQLNQLLHKIVIIIYRSEILICGTDRQYRSKTAKSRIFCPHVCGLSHFESIQSHRKTPAESSEIHATLL